MMSFILLVELSIILGFLLDLLLADPVSALHPVVVMGRGIGFLERNLRKIFPSSVRGKRAAGTLMAVLMPVTTYVISAGLCLLAWMIHPLLFFGIHTLWCWQAIAVRGLGREAKNVYRCLCKRSEVEEKRNVSGVDGKDNETGEEPRREATDLDEARIAVSRIVGRDTAGLDEKGIIRATVETVAENFSDGVMAPLFYMAVGGAPLALTYKSINTMDSMVGYKNEKYIDFGRAAARLDDAAGFIPARIGALLWILAAGAFERRAGASFDIWKRDRRNHSSPNAAQTEAACAGALGVQLAGPAYYFGEYYDKPTIGDAERDIEADDIMKTCRMMYGSSILGLILCLVLISIIWMPLVV